MVSGALACATCGVGKMRKALIDETGTVVNVIEIQDDSSYSPPEGHKLVASATASVGDTYANRKFSQPTIVEAVPDAKSDTAFTKEERRAIREQLGL